MKKIIFLPLILLVFFACEDNIPLNFIEYPETGIYGENLLDTAQTVYQASAVSLSAILSEEAGMRVKIVGESWRFTSSSMSQWTTGGFNENDNSRIFTSISTGTLDGRVEIYPGTSLELFVYENGSDGPSWSKSITVE